MGRISAGAAGVAAAFASVARSVPSLDHEHIERPRDYALVFAEDFTGTHTLDRSKWVLDQDHNAAWSDLANHFVGKLGPNCYVINGKLVLEATVASGVNTSDSPDQQKRYISASVATRNYRSWTYGYFEVRARLPVARGLLPAIWMMPAGERTKWPSDGEIDIAEQVGFDPETLSGTLHIEGATPAASTKVTLGQFHTYQLYWTADSVRVGVDRRGYMTYRRPPTADHLTWPFDRPFYLLLTLSVGGSWAGKQGIDERGMPAKMEVDYVRVYQRKARSNP